MAVLFEGDAFKLALDFAPNPMAVTHVGDGTFLFANQAFCQFFGCTLEQLTEIRAAELYAEPQERQQIVQKLQQAQGIDRLLVTFNTKPGGKRSALLSARLVELDGEDVIVSTLVPGAADERRALEEKLASAEGELQQFAYIVSHDLQEPLRMVDGYMQLIRQRYSNQLDQDGEEFIDFAVDGASRLQQMINDLLVYSRVHTRGGPMQPQQTGEVLQGVLANFDGVIADTQAKVNVGELPAVVADGAQLAMLFKQLLVNAFKFQGEAAPQVRIGAQPQQEMVQFFVEDNGIGIDAAHREQIFLIFRKLHGRERYPGTGMGLAIAKRIVDRHGGRIWIESEPGQGSTLYFTLPGSQGAE